MRYKILALMYFFAIPSAHAEQFTDVGSHITTLSQVEPQAVAISDLDGDGLLDALIGMENGNIGHYEQISVYSTDLLYVTNEFNNIDVGSRAIPVLADIDGDGLQDLIIGEDGGSLDHYEQASSKSLTFNLVTENFNSIDVGSRATPAFTDIDADGLLDMVIGEYDGNLNHYEQASSKSKTFSLATSSGITAIDVGSSSAPVFTDLDGDGLLDMVIGNSGGTLDHYEQASQKSATFSLNTTSSLNNIDLTSAVIPVFTDLDGDGRLDLLLAEYDGVIRYYEQASAKSLSFAAVVPESRLNALDIGSYAAPTFTDIDGDGLLDLVAGNGDGKLYHYEQSASDPEIYTLVSQNFASIDVGGFATPAFVDLDDDGRLDLIIGRYDGKLSHYEQSSAHSASFTVVSSAFNNIDVGSNSTPAFAGFGDDSQWDLLVGELDGFLNYYEQTSPFSSSFTLVSDDFGNGAESQLTAPAFADLDDDGQLDLIIGDINFQPSHFEQTEDNPLSFLYVTDEFGPKAIRNFALPVFADVNDDNSLDLVVGTSAGTFQLYLGNGSGSTANTASAGGTSDEDDDTADDTGTDSASENDDASASAGTNNSGSSSTGTTSTSAGCALRYY